MTTPWRIPEIKVLTSESNNPTASASATVNIVPDVNVKYVEGDIAVVQPNMKKREITPQNEKNVYKLIADAYMKNPIKINDYVIMQGEQLCQLVKELTGVKEVEIEAEVDINCCGVPSNYNVINNIICIKEDDTRVDFEIEYNKDFRLLQDYKISTKFTYDN